MDLITGFISIVVVGLITTIGIIVYVVPIIIANNTGATGIAVVDKSKCPEKSSGVRTSYKVTGYNDCYCITGSILNTENNKCESCPSGSSTLETAVRVPTVNGCYCSVGNMWDSTQSICIPYPEGSTTGNSGISIPGYPGLYCVTRSVWNDISKKCEMCPTGSTTTTTITPVPNRTGCFCTNGKIWDSSLEECVTGICDGHGTLQNGVCTCDSGYYLYNNTKCTRCIDGNPVGITCTCPENTSYSDAKDGCLAGV